MPPPNLFKTRVGTPGSEGHFIPVLHDVHKSGFDHHIFHRAGHAERFLHVGFYGRTVREVFAQDGVGFECSVVAEGFEAEFGLFDVAAGFEVAESIPKLAAAG